MELLLPVLEANNSPTGGTTCAHAGMPNKKSAAQCHTLTFAIVDK
jgi:hypothetical protein